MATQFALDFLETNKIPNYGVATQGIPAVVAVGESMKVTYTGNGKGDFLDTSGDSLLLGTIEDGAEAYELVITPTTDASATATYSVTIGGTEVAAAAAVAATAITVTPAGMAGLSGDIELLVGTVSTAAGLASVYTVTLGVQRLS